MGILLFFSLYYSFDKYAGSPKTLFTHSALTCLPYIICRGSAFVGPETIRNICMYIVLRPISGSWSPTLILTAPPNPITRHLHHDKPSHVDIDLLHALLVCSYFVKKGLCQEFCSMDSELAAPTSRSRHRPQVCWLTITIYISGVGGPDFLAREIWAGAVGGVGVGRRAMGHVAECGDVGTSTNVASPTGCCVMVRQHDVRRSFRKNHIYHVYATFAFAWELYH